MKDSILDILAQAILVVACVPVLAVMAITLPLWGPLLMFGWAINRIQSHAKRARDEG